MARKMLTVKVELDTIELLKLLADKEGRSQGKEVEQLIIKEAKIQKIKLIKK